MRGLQKDNIHYRGFIFFGLINVAGSPFVIEYNCRLGDPETESVLPRIGNDLVTLFTSAASGTLDRQKLITSPEHAVTVILASGGYPGDYVKGKVITCGNLPEGSYVFHAGTSADPQTGSTITSGGRVMAVTALGRSMDEALERAYQATDQICFDGMTCRRDIGFDLH